MLDDLRTRFESEVEKIGVSRIAAALGVARGTVYNWIANGNAPLDKLAMLQEQGFDAYFVITGQRGGGVSPPTLKPDEAALLDNYRHSPPEAQAALKATSAALAQYPCDKPAKGRA